MLFVQPSHVVAMLLPDMALIQAMLLPCNYPTGFLNDIDICHDIAMSWVTFPPSPYGSSLLRSSSAGRHGLLLVGGAWPQHGLRLVSRAWPQPRRGASGRPQLPALAHLRPQHWRQHGLCLQTGPELLKSKISADFRRMYNHVCELVLSQGAPHGPCWLGAS